MYKRREENQLDAAECFIALIICSTCFGHLHAHHQELETTGSAKKKCIHTSTKENSMLYVSSKFNYTLQVEYKLQ